MPGIHKNKTISFRANEWERIHIEERAALSGLSKKDFIIRSCINSNICFVGSKDNVKRIVDSVQEMTYTVREIAKKEEDMKFPLSDDTLREMSMRFTAMCVTIVEILDGAAYLFDKASEPCSCLSKEERLHQLLESLKLEDNSTK